MDATTADKLRECLRSDDAQIRHALADLEAKLTAWTQSMLSAQSTLQDIASQLDEREGSLRDAEEPITEEAPSEEMMPPHAVGAFDVDHDKIEESIERIIQQNYGERIETIVVKVIEKAVSKEIDKLKNILMEDNDSESV